MGAELKHGYVRFNTIITETPGIGDLPTFKS